ncbi:MAG: cyclic dehypoxanthinyl futalosine synthase [Candidatus Krumholzibacteria bacterium]|nr:cyclic dehypoxanthinyl futalosine synthase [Candidatus Krumholzibacteria bacterium]
MTPFSNDLSPMDPVQHQKLVQRKEEQRAGAEVPLIKVDPHRVPPVSTTFARDLLAESLSRRLTGGELLVLFEEASLHDLGRVAHELRMQRADTDYVTYIIDRNVTYTNLCYADCEFCAFNRHQGDGDEYLLELAEIVEKCRTVSEAGGNQILLQGGHHPKKRLNYYVELLEGIKKHWPDMWIHGFSPSEIQHFGRLNGMPTPEVLKQLKAAGLDSIPGGGAEILNDRVRSILAPGKTMSDEWIEISEQAHGIGLNTTATMMFCHVETLAERVEHFLRLRESQDRTGGYTAFIPWTFQPDNTPLVKRQELMDIVLSHGYLGATDYLRTLAISRIALDNFSNIQSSWVTQGKAIGQMTLHFGANDLGSLMMEESVVSAAGVSHPLTTQDLDEMVVGAGFKPALRDNAYNRLA